MHWLLKNHTQLQTVWVNQSQRASESCLNWDLSSRVLSVLARPPVLLTFIIRGHCWSSCLSSVITKSQNWLPNRRAFICNEPAAAPAPSLGASQMLLVVKNVLAIAGDTRDMDLIPRLGRSSSVGNDYPLQYSCLKNPMNKEPGGLQSRGHKE